MERNDSIPIDKLDANDPKIFYSFQKKYSQQNRYDKFSVLKNITPNREYYNVAMPDYMTLTYEFTIWTSYIEQMNQIVEKINYSDGAYWGEPGKMRFRTRIESFSDASQIDGERLIKTTFSVNLYGYILPETYDSKTTTQKYLTPKKMIIREDVDKSLETIQKDEIGAVGVGESTKDIFSVSLTNAITLISGTGVTVSNSGFGFDGSSTLLQEFSIGQPVATTDSPTFSSLTADSVSIGTGTTVISDGAISSSTGVVEITGSSQVTGSFDIAGNLSVSGSLTSSILLEQITTRSIDFSTGSNQFGDDLNDEHTFTGSLDITGSFKLNGYSINEISNDSNFTDGSTTALVTEAALKSFNPSSTTTDETLYLRKNFFKTSAGISGSNTASFTATTASAPSGVTATSINDFVFFINGQYMEHDALTIRQKATGSFHLQVDTTSIGYSLESDDEILAIGKFNS